MTKHRQTPKHHYIMQLLTVAVFPIAIYLLDLASKLYSMAAFAAGIVVFLKVLFELVSRPTSPAPSARRQAQPRLGSPTVAIVGPCYLCGARRQLIAHQIGPRQKVWVCQRCNHCMTFSHYSS